MEHSINIVEMNFHTKYLQIIQPQDFPLSKLFYYTNSTNDDMYRLYELHCQIMQLQNFDFSCIWYLKYILTDYTLPHTAGKVR